MYRCALCATTVPARTPAVHVVTEARLRSYPVRPRAMRVKHLGKVDYYDDPGGRGVEIVREVLACAACAAVHDGPVLVPH